MALSSKVKNKLVDMMNMSFTNIGHTTGMKMPKSDNNNEHAAWELFVAQHLLSMATKRKDTAEKDAIAAGVIIDKEKAPKPEGTREVIYNGDVVSISLEVRTGGTRVSVNVMSDYLAEKGVPQKLLMEAMAFATSKSRPAHVFTSMLITNDAIGK
jgi:hypothetical protein